MSLNTYLRLDFVKPAHIGFMSVYKTSLLEAISASGSVSAAARVMKVEPQNLREAVRDINEDFGGIIVLKRDGRGAPL